MKLGWSHLSRGFFVFRVIREDWGRFMEWRRALRCPYLGWTC